MSCWFIKGQVAEYAKFDLAYMSSKECRAFLKTCLYIVEMSTTKKRSKSCLPLIILSTSVDSGHFTWPEPSDINCSIHERPEFCYRDPSFLSRSWEVWNCHAFDIPKARHSVWKKFDYSNWLSFVERENLDVKWSLISEEIESHVLLLLACPFTFFVEDYT